MKHFPALLLAALAFLWLAPTPARAESPEKQAARAQLDAMDAQMKVLSAQIDTQNRIANDSDCPSEMRTRAFHQSSQLRQAYGQLQGARSRLWSAMTRMK